jgi:hypothetical protein
MRELPTLFDPYRVQNSAFLSQLLEIWCYQLQYHFAVTLPMIAYDSGVPEVIWKRLIRYYLHPAKDPDVQVEDLHDVFYRLWLLYPQTQFWAQDDRVWIQL